MSDEEKEDDHNIRKNGDEELARCACFPCFILLHANVAGFDFCNVLLELRKIVHTHIVTRKFCHDPICLLHYPRNSRSVPM